jgi:hypothetical protein
MMSLAQEDRAKSRYRHSLHQVFPSVVSLAKYLSIITATSENVEANDVNNDSENEISRFLNDVYVLPEDSCDQASANQLMLPSASSERASLNDIVNRLIAQTIRLHNANSNNYRELNCLALGYRSKSATSETEMRSFFDVECYHVNTLHAFLYKAPWFRLAEKYGEVILRRILSRPIFIRSKNSCYLQISGSPVPALIHKFSDPTANPLFTGTKAYGSIQIPRYMILYWNSSCRRIWRLLHKKFISFASVQVSENTELDELTDRCFGISQLQVSSETRQKLCRSLLSTVQGIASCYKLINISNILTFHCPEPESKQPPTTSSSTELSITRKRTRRGCRAGKLVKRRRLEGNPIEISNICNSGSSPISNMTCKSPLETVGEGLISRLVENVSHAVKLFDSKDFISQDPRMLTSSSIPQSVMQSPYAQLSNISINSSNEAILPSTQTLCYDPVKSCDSEEAMGQSKEVTAEDLSEQKKLSTDTVVSQAWVPDPLLTLSSIDPTINPSGAAFHLHRRFLSYVSRGLHISLHNFILTVGLRPAIGSPIERMNRSVSHRRSQGRDRVAHNQTITSRGACSI